MIGKAMMDELSRPLVNVPAGSLGDPATWNEEQRRNAMLYMRCNTCGAPREVEMIRDESGELTSTGVVCPNGHPQH